MKPEIARLCAFLALSGCATSPAIRSAQDLPIKSVVLYRSGVGYFERDGSFEGDALKFAVKQREVGDFLASLTAVEQGQGGVRSIAFDVPETKAPSPCPEEGPCPEPPDPGEQTVTVKLLLSPEAEHALHVAYVVGAPIWRPSYRVVFDNKERALLQAWAVVQNVSGEDWRDVKLSLTTGAPISFRTDLGTPITPERPMVSDSGEVVSAVPLAETSLDQGALAAAPPPAPEANLADEAEEVAPMAERAKAKKERAPAADLAQRSMGYAAKPAPAPSMGARELERAVSVQARATALEGTVTRYDLDHPVTIPSGGSTMVAIVSTRVPGEKAHLYAPDPGVSLSYQHPFSVARLKNDTGAVLEKGPVSVLSEGTFLGQGVLDTLPRNADTFVPFALDKSLVVEQSDHYDQQLGQLVRVRRGMVTVQSFSQRTTRYHVRNGGDKAAKVYVRHARWGEAELLTPPEGTELAPGRALVPVSVPAKGEQELKVVERSPVQNEFGFMDQPAADAIGVWLSGPGAEAAEGPALREALQRREELMKLGEQITALSREQNELQNSQHETRENLKAIEKVKTAADLRARLVTRLKQLDARLADLTRALVEARTRQSELEVRLNEALEGLSLSAK